MIIQIKSDDGQDFAVKICEGTGGIGIAVSHCDGLGGEMQDFTIDEVRTIVGVLNTAIEMAERENDELEARNGN